MKTKIALLLFLMTAGIHLVSSQAIPTNTSCPNTNSIITKLNLHKLSTPVITDRVCASEFTKYGTCCDQWNLPYEALHDSNRVTPAVERLISEYKLFNGFLHKYFLLVKEQAFAPLENVHWVSYMNQRIQKAHEFVQREDVKAFFKAYSKEYDQADVDDYTTHTKKCWDHMMHMRNASLCAACSGRSNIFFTNGKANVSPNQCKALVDDCHVSFRKTIRFIESYKDLAAFNAISESSFDIQISAWKFNSDLSKAFYKKIEDDGIIPLLNNYDPATSAADVSNSICGKLLNLRDKTFAEHVQDLFTNNSPWTANRWSFNDWINTHRAEINAKIAQYDASLGIRHANPAAGSGTPNGNWNLRRLLTMGGIVTAPHNLLIADTNVFQVGNYGFSSSTQSVIDAQATMNLDAMFP